MKQLLLEANSEKVTNRGEPVYIFRFCRIYKETPPWGGASWRVYPAASGADECAFAVGYGGTRKNRIIRPSAMR